MKKINLTGNMKKVLFKKKKKGHDTSKPTVQDLFHSAAEAEQKFCVNKSVLVCGGTCQSVLAEIIIKNQSELSKSQGVVTVNQMLAYLFGMILHVIISKTSTTPENSPFLMLVKHF